MFSDDFAVMMSLYLAMAVSDELWSSSKDVSNKPSKPLPPFPLTGNANGPSCQSVPSVRVTPKSKKCHEHKGQTSLEVSYMATSGFGYNPATATSVNMVTDASAIGTAHSNKTSQDNQQVILEEKSRYRPF